MTIIGGAALLAFCLILLWIIEKGKEEIR